MEDCEKSDLRQIGPDEEVCEDECREKNYRQESCSEQWPEGWMAEEVIEALESRSKMDLAFVGALFTLKGYSQLHRARGGWYLAMAFNFEGDLGLVLGYCSLHEAAHR